MSVITEPVKVARDQVDAYDHRNDTAVTDLLSQLDETVAGLRKALRINCPPGLHVDAVADSRLDLLVRFAAEVRTSCEKAAVYTDHEPEAAEVDQPARPQMYAVTQDDLRRIEAAGWMRGYDAGYAAAGDEAIEVES